MYGTDSLCVGRGENAMHWRAVGYLRLSREDEQAGESVSISGPRALLEQWAHGRRDVELLGFYTDDGVSGATFERPGFACMIADARRGSFDTIVVKDLSRFGRSYLDCGNWIERELPQLGIRLYSIADGFDSAQALDQNTAILLPVKNLINEMHVIATSDKVRQSLSVKRERGDFVGNYAPYGYRKRADDKHLLEVDEPAASVVRDIFAWRQLGQSANQIARRLNSQNVPCPSVYRSQQGGAYKTPFAGKHPLWHAKTVLRILRDESYTGTVVQGKTQRPNWRLRANMPVPRSKWCRTHNAHAPIVDKDLFERVARLLET